MATLQELLQQQQQLSLGQGLPPLDTSGMQPNLPPAAPAPVQPQPQQEEITPMQMALSQAMQSMSGGVGAGLASRLSNGAVRPSDYKTAIGNGQSNILDMLQQKMNAQTEEAQYQKRRGEKLEDSSKEILFRKQMEAEYRQPRESKLDPYGKEATESKIAVKKAGIQKKEPPMTEFRLWLKQNPGKLIDDYFKLKRSKPVDKMTKPQKFREARQLSKDFTNLTQEEKVRLQGMFTDMIAETGYSLVPKTKKGGFLSSDETTWSAKPHDKYGHARGETQTIIVNGEEKEATYLGNDQWR